MYKNKHPKEQKHFDEAIDALNNFAEVMQEQARLYEKECDDYWSNLSYEEQLKAFYSVVKRIHRAEIVENTSYRGALYDVFGFDLDSYGVGMECGYLDLHNAIYTDAELKEYNKQQGPKCAEPSDNNPWKGINMPPPLDIEKK
jgi:hypothetical protein